MRIEQPGHLYFDTLFLHSWHVAASLAFGFWFVEWNSIILELRSLGQKFCTSHSFFLKKIKM